MLYVRLALDVAHRGLEYQRAQRLGHEGVPGELGEAGVEARIDGRARVELVRRHTLVDAQGEDFLVARALNRQADAEALEAAANLLYLVHLGSGVGADHIAAAGIADKIALVGEDVQRLLCRGLADGVFLRHAALRQEFARGNLALDNLPLQIDVYLLGKADCHGERLLSATR